MNELSALVELIGEDNKKKLQDGITELIIQKIENDLDEMINIIDFNRIFDEINEPI